MRLITRGAAAWFDKVAAQCQNSRRLDRPRRERWHGLRLSPRAREYFAPASPDQPPRERPTTFVRPECGLRRQPAPQLHR